MPDWKLKDKPTKLTFVGENILCCLTKCSLLNLRSYAWLLKIFSIVSFVYTSNHLVGETVQVSRCQVAKQATDVFVQPQVASPLGGWHSGRTWMQISECGQKIRLSLKALCNTAERRVLTTIALAGFIDS